MRIKLPVAVWCWGVGREGEIYHGIGRGELNIAGLPVYRDAVGGVGTPTSDEERTKIGLDTTHLLMIINGYSGLEGLEAAGKVCRGLIKQICFSYKHGGGTCHSQRSDENSAIILL